MKRSGTQKRGGNGGASARLSGMSHLDGAGSKIEIVYKLPVDGLRQGMFSSVAQVLIKRAVEGKRKFSTSIRYM